MGNIKTFEEFLNEKYSNFDMQLLKKQGFELGDMLKNKSELKKGDIYCIVDMGMVQWQGGFKYDGFKSGKHKFISTLGDDMELEYTDDEIIDSIEDGQIADCI